MLQRSARVVGLERSDRRSQESQLLASAGLGAKSTRRQLTAQEASRTRARIRVPTEPITEPEDDDFDEDSAGAAGDLGHGLGDVRMHEHLVGDAAAHTGFTRDHRALATVPEEVDEELDGGHDDCMHENLLGDAAAPTGFCRDHRGKLQSCWELDEDAAGHEAEDGEDEADHVFRAGADTAPVPARPQAQGQLLSAKPWPADRQVSGALELRGCAARRKPSDRQATCTIQHGVMTFCSAMRPGAEIVVLAQVQLSDIVATIVSDQSRKFSICNPEDIDSTQVWCCAKDQEKRDEWLAILHRLGVHLYREDEDGRIRLVRQGV